MGQYTLAKNVYFFAGYLRLAVLTITIGIKNNRPKTGLNRAWEDLGSAILGSINQVNIVIFHSFMYQFTKEYGVFKVF